MDNRDIADILRDIGTYMELMGENPFKTRAFLAAARSVETYPEPLERCARGGNLPAIKGAGASIRKIIMEILADGMSSDLEALKASIPEGVTELLTLQGMGPKKVRAVWKTLGITGLGELEYACRENRLLSLDGFGEKSQEKILKAIEFRKTNRGSFLLHEAAAVAEEIKKILEASGFFKSVTVAGSLRRGKKYVKDADILVVPKTGTPPEKIAPSLIGLADSDGIIASGPTKVSIRRHGLQVDFRIVPEESSAAALQYFTGSKEHNTMLRGRAKDAGLKLNEYGVYRGDERLAAEKEEDVYRLLGLPWIAPELREAAGEIGAAEKGALPRLIEKTDIRGMIHVHSNYSDGRYTIRELAEACKHRGFSYLCLTDHSRSAYYAGGLSIERLREQNAEIKRINEETAPFRVFSGIESDILSDGSLDYPDEVLASLDFTIGSIHSKLTMKKEEATERLVRAIANPWLTILGHISGRLLLSRDGYPYDEERILDALASSGAVLEHNCNPHRLDPDWEFLKRAKERGILICLSPDTHDIDGFDDIAFGLTMARKAWCEKADVLNTLTGDEIDGYFKRRKKQKGA
ncbi:MAG: DNA polymerase/3'-5' exonuclease PolX [Spirochaetales bacterium]|nr:DNA polymerase/3'-5' exonuclease PolX [Spirochaetales bacterium]